MENNGNNINELITYYSTSKLEGEGGLDLKSVIGDALKENMVKMTKKEKKKLHYTQDSNGIIDFYCLRDANEYFNKSIYLLLCYKYLQRGGYDSWSKVTFYYPRFYLNISLCKLQGYSHFSYRPPVELIRTNWTERTYGFRTSKAGSPHAHIWDCAKEYYKNFDSKGLSSINDRTIKSMFDDEYYKQYGIKLGRDELKWRNSITYEATGFDELYYTGESSPSNWVKYEGRDNYIDPEFFRIISMQESYDGTGVEEAGIGSMIEFMIEMLGKISNSIENGSNICYLRIKRFELLDTNNATLNTIRNWSEAYELNCV